MKKIVALFLILTFLLVPLSACGDEEENAATTAPPAASQEPTSKEDPEIDMTDYSAMVTLRLASLTETPASDFVYEIGMDGATVLSYTGSAETVRIPERLGIVTVTKIADGAFANNQTLKTLYIPDCVTALGKGILSGCTALESIYTPLLSENAAGTQFLGYLFGFDDYTDNIKVPASLAFVQVGGSLSTVSARAFADCNKLVAVVLGDHVNAVENFAFYNCEKLKFVNLDGLTRIGSYAFASCKVLVKADLCAELTSVGLGAFQGCAALSSMTLPFVGGSQTENTYLGYVFGASEPDFTAGFIPAYLRKIQLLDTCTSLGNYSFFECSSLCSVKLSNNLIVIGVRAFEGCTGLSELVLPDSLQSIRENAFFGCTSLAKLTFGSGLQIMGINSFYGCTALKEIALPASLRALPASAFADCTALETVDFGGVTKVGKNAFRNCNAIKTVYAAASIELEDGNASVEALLED